MNIKKMKKQITLNLYMQCYKCNKIFSSDFKEMDNIYHINDPEPYCPICQEAKKCH